jgi:hypothetical protein
MAQLPQEERINYFNIAKEAAFLRYNPLYWYKYNPGMYSVSRGQIRMPFSGRSLRGFAKGMRQMGGGGLVDWVKNTFAIDTSSNVMRSKEMWFGLGSDKSRFDIGIKAVVGDYRAPIGSQQLRLGYYPNIPNFPRQPIYTDRLAPQPSAFRIKPYQKQLPYKPSPTIPRFTRDMKYPNRPFTTGFGGSVYKQKLLEYKSNIGIMTDPTDPAKFTIGRDTTPVGTVGAGRAGAQRVREARETIIGKPTSITKVPKPKWYSPLRGSGKRFAVGAGRLGVKAGVMGLKGFAYYQLGKLMWDAINFVMEPVGRASVQAVDNAFRRYESIPQVEMGGSIAMSYLSHGASTERQRAISAISKAHINGRSALGQEAMYSHQ